MKIGILDTSYNNCASHVANHVAFTSATVEFTHDLATCDTDDGSDCPTHPNDTYVDCVSGVVSNETRRGAESKDLTNDGTDQNFCVVPKDKDHETEVASRTAQRRSDPATKRHAAEVHLVIYNGPKDYLESATAYRSALDKLASHNVDIINKSWGEVSSMHDVNEGFDATLDDTWYDVRLFGGKNKQDDGCDGDEGDPGWVVVNWWWP